MLGEKERKTSEPPKAVGHTMRLVLQAFKLKIAAKIFAHSTGSEMQSQLNVVVAGWCFRWCCCCCCCCCSGPAALMRRQMFTLSP